MVILHPLPIVTNHSSFSRKFLHFSTMAIVDHNLFDCLCLSIWALFASFPYHFITRWLGFAVVISSTNVNVKVKDFWVCWWYFGSITKYQCCFLKKINKWTAFEGPECKNSSWIDWNFPFLYMIVWVHICIFPMCKKWMPRICINELEFYDKCEDFKWKLSVTIS